MKNLREFYGKYIETVYTIVFGIAVIWQGIAYYINMAEVGNSGQTGTALVMFLLSTLIIPLLGLLTAAIWGTFVMLVGILPFTIIKILTTKKEVQD